MDMIKLLLSCSQINPNIGKVEHVNDGSMVISPLGLAVKKGLTEIVKILVLDPRIEIGTGCVKYETFGATNYTCLDLACGESLFKVVELLLFHPYVQVNLPLLHHHTHLRRYPLTVACENNCIEIVRLLLARPEIDINVTQDPKHNNCIDQFSLNTPMFSIEEIRKVGFNYQIIYDLIVAGLTPSNPTLLKDYSLEEIKRRKFKYFTNRIIIQKFEWDKIGDTNLTAFVPLLKIMDPELETILKLGVNFDKEEERFVQTVIDFLIYGSDIDFRQLFQAYSNKGHNANIKGVIGALVLCGSLPQINSLCYECISILIKDEYSLDMVFNIWKIIHEYEKRFPSLLQSMNKSLVGKIKQHVLDCIGNFGLKKDANISEFLSDFDNYHEVIEALMKRRATPSFPKFSKNETISFPFSSVKLFDQLALDSTTDIELQIGKERVKCHRTILMSKSTYFATLLNGNWNSQNDNYPIEMKYLIQFCYGFLEYVEPKLCIPLMKLANMHEMKELAIQVEKQAIITRINVAEYLNSLLNDVEEQENEIIQEFIRRIVLYK
ncbi:predicted protein [Naegleria gruberi]|uniref:Predicted protein n=1 Tax=Naegleria gruberi TaxID=5762 RepID=D2V912_NAEGR|nr:uncharacterized protein NAEGRDRAFT_65352 [Naegleria gruberi]EFC46785.1 predicted protein [Naegleria gruberi]|eukprot:XP_002679529.1 predicted protein [Naegleria gruberi strain NEG-M]